MSQVNVSICKQTSYVESDFLMWNNGSECRTLQANVVCRMSQADVVYRGECQISFVTSECRKLQANPEFLMTRGNAQCRTKQANVVSCEQMPYVE